MAEDTIKDIFGSNLRNRRKALELTQEVLAERVDLTFEALGKIERGQTYTSFRTVEKIAKALGVPAIALFATDPAAVPLGSRGSMLTRIHATLADMNEDQLSRIANMLDAFMKR